MQEHNWVAASAEQRQAARRSVVGRGGEVFMVKIAFTGDDEQASENLREIFSNQVRNGEATIIQARDGG